MNTRCARAVALNLLLISTPALLACQEEPVTTTRTGTILVSPEPVNPTTTPAAGDDDSTAGAMATTTPATTTDPSTSSAMSDATPDTTPADDASTDDAMAMPDGSSEPMGTAGTGGGEPTDGEPLTEAEACVQEAAAMGETDACTVCSCNSCTAEIADCQDAACLAIVECGRAAGCSGSDCYCGIGADPIGCALSGASGPCKQEIVDASGLLGTDGCDSVDMCAQPLAMLPDTEPDNAVTRAGVLSVCTQGREATDAIAIAGIPAMPAIAGMCETECAP